MLICMACVWLAAGSSASAVDEGTVPAGAMIDATVIVARPNAKRADAFIHNLAGRMGRPVHRKITLPGQGVKSADDLPTRPAAAALASGDRNIERRPVDTRLPRGDNE